MVLLFYEIAPHGTVWQKSTVQSTDKCVQCKRRIHQCLVLPSLVRWSEEANTPPASLSSPAGKCAGEGMREVQRRSRGPSSPDLPSNWSPSGREGNRVLLVPLTRSSLKSISSSNTDNVLLLPCAVTRKIARGKCTAAVGMREGQVNAFFSWQYPRLHRNRLSTNSPYPFTFRQQSLCALFAIQSHQLFPLLHASTAFKVIVAFPSVSKDHVDRFWLAGSQMEKKPMQFASNMMLIFLKIIAKSRGGRIACIILSPG